MNSQKVENSFLSSFRRKPESSKFNYFWMPDQVRHDSFGTFYETINFDEFVKSRIKEVLNADFDSLFLKKR